MLKKLKYILQLSMHTLSLVEIRKVSQHDCKIIVWDVNNQHKQLSFVDHINFCTLIILPYISLAVMF